MRGAIRFFTNAEYGVTSLIYKSPVHGYTVALRDDNAWKTAPYLRPFREYADAEDYAKELVAR